MTRKLLIAAAAFAALLATPAAASTPATSGQQLTARGWCTIWPNAPRCQTPA